MASRKRRTGRLVMNDGEAAAIRKIRRATDTAQGTGDYSAVREAFHAWLMARIEAPSSTS
jgi:hypothetical protein